MLQSPNQTSALVCVSLTAPSVLQAFSELSHHHAELSASSPLLSATRGAYTHCQEEPSH